MILAAALVLVSPSASSQVTNLLKRKANQAIEKAVMKEAEREIDKIAEKEASERSEDKERKPLFNMDLSMMGLGSTEVTIDHKDVYSFSSVVEMEMESYEEEGPYNKYMYNMYYSATDPVSAIEVYPVTEDGSATEAGLFVIDMVNKCFLMLSNASGSKAGIITPVEDDPSLDEETMETDIPAEATLDQGLRKSGRTKNIAGYRCEEYVAADENSSVNIWFTNDIKLKINKSAWQKSGMPEYYGWNEFREGMVMEMESFESGKLTGRMVTKKVDNNASFNVNTREYKLMQIKVDVPEPEK